MVDPAFQRRLEALARTYNAGDLVAYLAHLHPEITFRGPLSGERTVGRELVGRVIRLARERLRLRKIDYASGFQCQRVVAVEWLGVAEAPDGSTLNLKGILVVSFGAEDLIEDMQFFWDPRPLLGHLQGSP